MRSRYALALLLLLPAALSAADSDYRYLAANQDLRANLQNVNVVMGQATYAGKVLEVDQSWESGYKLGYPGSVVVDPETGQWRMYYEMYVSNMSRCVAMATSDDGVNWTKPALNATGTTYTTDPNNNFVNLPQTWMSSPCAFIDPSTGQYNMSVTVNESVMYAMTSSDGVNFSIAGTIYTKDSSTTVLDSLNVSFWDSNTGQYAAYMRTWYAADGTSPARRGVFTKWSDAWSGTWAATKEYTIDPKDEFGAGYGNPDLYTPGVMSYHGQYIGLPAMFFHPDGTDGAIYPTFMYSSDGSNWSFEDASHSILDLSAHGQDETTFGMAFASTSVVEVDGELYIYYSYIPEQHDVSNRSATTYHLAKIRSDGFVGIESAEGEIGTWTTSEITLSDDPGGLIINAVVRGSLTVEVLDATTLQPLEGFAESDALVIEAGDYLDAEAQWDGLADLNDLAGRTVAFRFIMDDATIYSFSFQEMPEPSTLALLVIGAVSVFVWRKHRSTRNETMQ